MLVLALQFSKGSERGRTHEIDSYGARRGQRERELHAVAEVRGPFAGRLPQNGREDKACRAGLSRGRILRLTCHFDLPTNAPTGSGSNRVGRMPTND